jgi:hypothetical protein
MQRGLAVTTLGLAGMIAATSAPACAAADLDLSQPAAEITAQIEACWPVRQPESQGSITFRIHVQSDGFIQSFERLGGSSASVRTVEAAIRALSDRRCQPHLPANMRDGGRSRSPFQPEPLYQRKLEYSQALKRR